MLHGLQIDVVPGVTVLQEKRCLLNCPESGSLSLQLSQSCDVGVRTDGLSGFQETQKDHSLPTPKDIAHHFTCCGLHLELLL